MSIPFNDTTNYKGLVQLYERELGFNQGDVSGNATRLKQFTADCNVALDDFFALAIPASGTWQLDDSNQTDYPIIKTNLVSGQQDYSFTTDESGNLILDIYKVLILPSATATTYQEICPIDQQSETTDVDTETGSTGTPCWYDKTANGIFLDPKPNYNATLGLKILINREATYFTSSDTTKKPGVTGLFHSYFYLKPALEEARRKSLTMERKLKEKVLELEDGIKKYYGHRSRDERFALTTKQINFR